jgi:hypothetical protein
MDNTVVIMPNYNGGDIVFRSIESTLKQTEELKLIVIDDASSDGSFEKINKRFKVYVSAGRLLCINNPKNLGIAKSLNRGIKYAISHFNPKYIIKQDNDLILDFNCIESLINCAKCNKRSGVVGGKIYILDKPEYIQHIGHKIYYFFGMPIIKSIGVRVRGRQRFNAEVDLDLVAGCLMLFKKEVFDEIGYFYEEFSKNDFEDFDFTIKAKKSGFEVVYCWKAVGYHKISFSSQGSSYGRSYSKSYSRIKMIKKNFGNKAFIFYSFAFFLYLFYDWIIRKRSFVGTFKGHLRGIRDSFSLS